MTGHRNHPEILAPAGTFEAMEAAVKAGCDAVYAGGSLFSARAYAGNFDQEAFLKAIDHCHLFGVRVYMTVNTLLKEEELKELVPYVRPFYEAGLDGVLVQDMGVFRTLKDAFPLLPLHVSTQMSISSAFGAQLAKDLGFTRIVPARELSLAEIREIREKVDIEIETFVHGAMCFAYSGKCLLSSFAGGRSGNRGRCAQPCRKCYEIFDTGKEENGPSIREYIMSLKDICMLEELPLLIDAGIDSFKIEGRMKNAYYVASVVSAYRRERDLYLDLAAKEKAACFDELSESAKAAYHSQAAADKQMLEEIYNRGGFHSGYYFTEKGKEMAALSRPNHQGVRIGTVEFVKPPKIGVRLEKAIGQGDVYEIRDGGSPDSGKPSDAEVELTSGAEGKAGECVLLNANRFRQIRPGMEVFRTRNASLLRKIEQEILNTEPAVAAECRIEAQTGRPLKIILCAKGAGADGGDVSVCAEDEPVQKALREPTGREVLIGKMKKSSPEGILAEPVECIADADAFVPMSRFNALRRRVAKELKEKIIEGYRRSGEK